MLPLLWDTSVRLQLLRNKLQHVAIDSYMRNVKVLESGAVEKCLHNPVCVTSVRLKVGAECDLPRWVSEKLLKGSPLSKGPAFA